MKVEYCSRYRDRVAFPKAGQFMIEAGVSSRVKTDARDSVCFSAPIISFQGGFSLAGTIVSPSAIDIDSTEIVVQFAAAPPVQCRRADFLAGCVIQSATLNLRVLKSEARSTVLYKLTCPYVSSIVLGQACTVIDYTDYSTLNVRAPLVFDMGQFEILYNERLNQALTIRHCDLITRKLSFVQTSAAGWLATDNVNIRDELPQQILTVVSTTTNTLTFAAGALSQANVGDWLRLRLPAYATVPASDSWSRRIVSVQASNRCTVFPNLPVFAATTVELLPFSYDNTYPVQIYDRLPKKPYKVKLESLTLPNQPLVNGNLSGISQLMIEMHNNDNSLMQKHMLNSNNLQIPESIWFAKLDPEALRFDSRLRFITCDTTQVSQNLILDLREPVRITIRLPDGYVYEPLESENASPAGTFQDLNITLIFHFEEITDVDEYELQGYR